MSPTSDPSPINFAPFGYALLLLAVAWVVRDARANRAAATMGWHWWALVGAVLLAFRWPLLWVPHQLNPDESQLIAGAISLRHDPVFWRSVDGGTAGPLDFFPLLPATFAEGVASYAVARALALAALLATLGLVGETIALFAGGAVARVTLLPSLAFYALTTNPDFTHVSTEIMPLLLLAAAGWCAARTVMASTRATWWGAAALLGAVPWAKLQAAPFALALGGLMAWWSFNSERKHLLGPLVIGALVPSLVIVGLVALGGQLEPMLVTYFLYNLAYFDAPQFTWWGNLVAQARNTVTDGYLGYLLAAISVLGAGTLTRWRAASALQRRQVGAAALLLVVGLLCALAPRRPSAHHLQFVVLPLLWLTGAMLAIHLPRTLTGEPPPNLRLRVAVFLTCCVLPPLVWRGTQSDAFAFINTRTPSPQRLQLAAQVRGATDAGEPLAIWGSRVSLYVETGRRQATRQAHTGPQIHSGPLQRYFLKCYLEDVRAANPPVFVDAVGPGSFFFTDRREAHEAFPPLRAWVREHYTLVTELDGARLFVRNDRLGRIATAR